MTSDMTPGVTPAKPRSWLRLALIGSLVANMLFVGLFAGAMLRPGGWHGHKGHGPGAFMWQLPRERREAIRNQFLKDREELKGKRQRIGELREKARVLIAKEPFDAEAVKAAVAEIGAARAELHGLASERFVQLLSGMSAEERKLFLEHRRHLRKWRRRGAEDGGDEGRDGI